MPIAEIISVGTELLFGEILDSNAAFYAQELLLGGYTLHRKTVLGDNLQRLSGAITQALGRADLVIVGGGLGPTDDDLTREAIAAALGQTPQEDPELLAHVQALYSSRGREMPASNRKQAWLIPAAEALPNPVGTAPGWWVTVGEKIIVALPGPPLENKTMWREQVLPRLPRSEQTLLHTTLHTHGIGESQVADVLGDLTTSANPSVATYARAFGVDVRVAASGLTPQGAQVLLATVLPQVEERLAQWVWGRDDDTLAKLCAQQIGTRRVGVIEVGSGGAVAQALADMTQFAGAQVIASQPDLRQSAAEALAQRAAQAHDAELGLAVSVATSGPQAGQGWVSVYTAGQMHSHTLNWPGNAAQIRERAVAAALALLLRSLRGQK